MFDVKSPYSIIAFAKKLKNKSLREACGNAIESDEYKGKGNFGQLLEKYYFGYEPNSRSEPDFAEAGLELKTSPLKTLKNGTFRSKERLVLNIINYLDVHKESFNESSFWKKNAHLLLIFYLHDKSVNILDFVIKLVEGWQYPPEDLKVIQHDWQIIQQKIKNGKAHELSEGDTFYLGACTKGATAQKSYRKQPFSKQKAKQRAYSLKQGYVNHIIATISKGEKGIYGKIISTPDLLDADATISDIALRKFQSFLGLEAHQIEQKLGLSVGKKSKSHLANLTKAILGVELDKKIEEFEKADIQVKTIRIKNNDLPKEHISFPAFNFMQLSKVTWEESSLRQICEQKFFFVFYQIKEKKLFLRKVRFWNMPYLDIQEAKNVWLKTQQLIQEGHIVKSLTPNGIRRTNFPKPKENRVCHVRPHARNKYDTFPLPTIDKLTEVSNYMKHCFWLNASYVRDEILLKDT